MTKMGKRLSKQEKFNKKIEYLVKRRKTPRRAVLGANLIRRKASSVNSMKKQGRKRMIPLPKLKKKLWVLLREYILRRDKGICVSCRRPGNQCGHYIKKSVCNLIYQYSAVNLGCQCVRCNVFLNGNPVEYRKWMISKYGEEMTKKIEEEYNHSLPLGFNPRFFIEELIARYDSKYKPVEKTCNN